MKTGVVVATALLVASACFAQTKKELPLLDASVIANEAGKNVSRYVDEHIVDGYVRIRGNVYSIRPMPAWSYQVYRKGEFSFIEFQTQNSLNDHTAVVVIVSNAEAKKWNVGENAAIVVRFVGESDKDSKYPVMATHTLVFVQKDIS